MNVIKNFAEKGLSFHKNNKFTDAKKQYLEVLKLDPKNIQIKRLLALVEFSLENYENSLTILNECIKEKSNYSEAYCDRGMVNYKIKNINEAEEDYLKSIGIDNNLNALYNYGNLLKDKKLFTDALSYYDRAIEVNPNFIKAYQNRAYVNFIKNRDDEALRDFNKLLKFNPNNHDARFFKSSIELKNGDLIEGFKNYEIRWKSSNFPTKKKFFEGKVWDGKEDLKNKTILLYSEQGLGDQIQFIRFAYLILNKGAEVIIEVDKRLVGLLKETTNFKNIYHTNEKLPKYEFNCPIMSLPYKLKIDLNSIPNKPYLESDKRTINKWKNLFSDKFFNIGINWQGGIDPRQDFGRSFNIDYFEKISKIKNVKLFSLQKINGLDQIENRKNNFNLNIIDNMDIDNPFVDTAAIISNLDLVITSDTSIAHLSGALGKKTFLLLQKFSEWRWFKNRNDSPWYESIKLFRQKTEDQWDDVFLSVEKELINSNEILQN